MSPLDVAQLLQDPEALLRSLDRVEYEDSLYEFLRAAWRQIDPSPWMDGWPIEAIAEHLQAVTDGELKRLIINLPPRLGKSSTVSVAFPAWTWAQRFHSPTSGPSVPFLHASYATQLSLRDSVKCRRLIESPWYQSLWGDRFRLNTDQNTKSRFGNDRGGERLITSIGAAVTGEGGNIICFPANEIVATEAGAVPIGQLVRERRAARVWSMGAGGKLELRPVVGWFRNPGSTIVEVGLSDGRSFRCTPEHHVKTARGWVEAQDLRSDDMLPCFACLGVPHRSDRRAIPLCVDPEHLAPRADIANGIGRELSVAMVGSPAIEIGESARIVSRNPDLSLSDRPDGAGDDAKLSRKLRGRRVACEDFFDGGLGQSGLRVPLAAFEVDGIVGNGVSSVLLRGAVGQIVEPVVVPVSVKVADLDALGLSADESLHHGLVDADRYVATASPQINDMIAVVDAAGMDAGLGPHAPQVGNFIGREPRYLSPLFVRVVGHEPETFCIEVAETHNFLVGLSQVVVSNCIDDPNAANEAFSEATIQTTIDWFDSVMSTRLNDPKTGAYVIIQQRLAEDDLTGHVLSKDVGEWCHLMLPMRFEPDRAFVTKLGWQDPRTKDGELLWPERFGEPEVRSLERNLGPWGSSGQLQQRPEPKGGGIIKRDWWLNWQDQAFPPMDYIIASLDTAYTEKTENDPSALTVWGVFTTDPVAQAGRYIDADGRPQYIDRVYTEVTPSVMLMHAWREWLGFHDLVAKVADSCKKMKVDCLLVENKAAGISLEQEMRRLYGHEGFSIRFYDPKSQDKLARLYSVQPLFAPEMDPKDPAKVRRPGIVYAPDRTWADMVITEVSQFPKGKYRDLTDTCSQALIHLRNMGLLVLSPERLAEIEESKQYHGKGPEPLYPGA